MGKLLWNCFTVVYLSNQIVKCKYITGTCTLLVIVPVTRYSLLLAVNYLLVERNTVLATGLIGYKINGHNFWNFASLPAGLTQPGQAPLIFESSILGFARFQKSKKGLSAVLAQIKTKNRFIVNQVKYIIDTLPRISL